MRKTEPKKNRNNTPDPHATPIALPTALPVARENRIAEETQIKEQQIAEEQNHQIMPNREVRTCNPQTETR